MKEEVTQILNSIERGDPLAAGRLLPLVYNELKRLAAQKLSLEAAGQTLQATALVHEAYLRLVGDVDTGKWDNRGHFYIAASEAMRRILIDNARRKKSLKRGGGYVRCELRDDDAIIETDQRDTLLAIDEAMSKLAKEDPELEKLVQLRYFAGLTIDETAHVLNISPRTTKRNWAYARAWLRREIEGDIQ